ncbi:MAG: FAD-dependent oxidoreductase [Gemmatimonadota bacterium]|nr:MAG: FAD-dependent oxidoreductase [Gemmatimonadota bacterium]
MSDADRQTTGSSGHGQRVAVVGAGMAGITCTRSLVRAGRSVTLIDKARGPGGRMSTRRTEHGAIDHGAQYFTARNPRFREEVNAWIADGVVQEWHGPLATIGSDGLMMIRGDNRRFVGVPRMSALTRHLSASCKTLFNWRVARIERHGTDWWLHEERGARLGPFDLVVVAVPAPQAIPLLQGAPSLAMRARSAVLAGCYAVMLVYDERLPLPFDGAFVNRGPLSWIARNSSKPGREGAETWVLHASPDWSEAHIEEPPDQVIPMLLAAFAEAVNAKLPQPLLAVAHRWRHALPINLLEEPCLFDPELAIGACGDWCGGPRVEGAYLSGAALADLVIAHRDQPAG